VSNGAAALIMAAFDISAEDKQLETLKQGLLEHYQQVLGLHATLYDGIPETLHWLMQQDIPWGVVTNKPLRFAQPLLERLSLNEQSLAQSCAVLICPEDVSKTKPDPEPLLLAGKKVQRESANTIYIGDHVRDIAAGRAAGMHTIAAAYGYISEAEKIENWQADAIVDHPKQLLDAIISIYQQQQ
jgi:phosphoglycolate phosphatase